MLCKAIGQKYAAAAAAADDDDDDDDVVDYDDEDDDDDSDVCNDGYNGNDDVHDSDVGDYNDFQQQHKIISLFIDSSELSIYLYVVIIIIT
jgi:hypothetical protein